MAIGKRLRFEILKRDGFRCRYCGKTGAASELHVDHIVPSSKGGRDVASNLIAACIACNVGKSNVPLETVAAEKTDLDKLVDGVLRKAHCDAAAIAMELDHSYRFNCDIAIEDSFPDGVLPEGFM